jgi:hypothetical protein
MSRVLLPGLLCLMAACAPAQASLLGELRQSLLTGPAPADAAAAYRERSVSEQLPGGAAQDAFEQPQPGKRGPALYLMPVGDGDEPGLGVGLRIAF